MDKMSLQQRTIEYMKEFGSITSLEAVLDLGNTRLSGTIYCLRKKGYVIESKDETARNRWGQPTRYSRYFLISEPNSESGEQGNESTI